MPTHLLGDKIKFLLECRPGKLPGSQYACLEKARQYSGNSVIADYMRVFADSASNGSCIRVSSLQLLRVFTSFVGSRLQRLIFAAK